MFSWNQTYFQLAKNAEKQHYPNGAAAAFPCMRNTYPWNSARPTVPDSRVIAKNNDLYHSLQSYGIQYHNVAMYDFAAQHWLMAAAYRQDINQTHPQLANTGHDKAVDYCLQQYEYNNALSQWSQSGGKGEPPQPKQFNLKP